MSFEIRPRTQPRVQLQLPGNRRAVPLTVRALLVCEYETGETVVIDWDVDPHAIPEELLPPSERGLQVDTARQRVLVNGRVVDINSDMQFDVIRALWQADGHIVDRDRLIAEAWPATARYELTDEVVDSMIKRLRKKIAEIDPTREYIITERGRGFRLECHNG
jgi:DNA-binding response OmpR family regulator